VLACPSCGVELPGEFPFCPFCAAPLSEAALAPSHEERKVVTCLFCDLVGFTARAERLDPEDVRALLLPYHARLRFELERFGGTVEKFIGDAVMALFGAPVAHEDDPERAVRAALAIRDWVVEQGEGLQVRIAVATGEALVALGARPSEGEGMASGDVVNIAARLQAAAPVNGVLVDESTRRATRDAIVYQDAEPVEAKGKAEPIPVSVAVDPRARVGVERGHDALLVGRSEEVDLLVDALARVRRERSAQLVTIVGVPGIGKSRLVYELFRSVEEGDELVTWRHGRALPYGEAVTFWPLAEMVKAQAGILETDSPAEAEEKLHAAVAAVDAPEAGWVESHLRPLVGLGGAGGPSEAGRSEAFAAWRRFFESLAELRTLVLVFEDLHWADDGVLEFVDDLVEWASGVPMLVVCTARPELLSRHVGWGGGKANAATVSLSPLSDEQTAKLLGALLGRALLPAETQTTLLAVAGGNPLYAEQYARMLAERGRGEALELPETVQGIIAARVDGLSAEEKTLLQDASVVGRVFWLGAVAAIGGRDRWQTEELLHALDRKEFVRRERRSSAGGDDEYAFRHLLVRDVAYGQIPRGERAEKHRRAAEWIESLGRPEDHAETLVHHYLSALELSEAAGKDTAALREPARLALRDAAERAVALFAYATALSFYETALELWPEDDPERAELLFRRAEAAFQIDKPLEPLLEARDALLREGRSERAAEAETLLALAFWSRGEPRPTLEHAARAAAAVATAPPSRAKTFVLANQARMLAVTNHPEQAIVIGREAFALATSLGLGELRAHALNTIGLGRMSLDDSGGIEDLEQSLRLVLEQGTPFEITRVYNNLGWGYVYAGRMQQAVDAFEAQLETAQQFGLRDQTRWASMMLAVHSFTRGDWDRALTLVETVIEASEGPLDGPFALRAAIRLGRGELAGASADAQRALELTRASDQNVEDDALRLTFNIRLALANGRRSEAETFARDLETILDKALSLSRADGSLDVTLALWELDRPLDAIARAASAYPNRVWHQLAAAVARGELVEAADRLAELGARTYEAYIRLRAAERLIDEGRRGEGEAELTRALAFYRSVGASLYLPRAEALVAVGT
jgi:class 3 adenylate cyclase/tetratricopeptide (TPR) repeat protein